MSFSNRPNLEGELGLFGTKYLNRSKSISSQDYTFVCVHHLFRNGTEGRDIVGYVTISSRKISSRKY